MGHGDRLDAHVGQTRHPRFDRAVQPAARLPHHQRAVPAGPVGHFGVVADHGDGQRGRRRHHLFGHPADQGLAGIVGKGGAEPSLGLGEGLDRDEDGPLAQQRCRGRDRRPCSHRQRALRCRGSPRQCTGPPVPPTGRAPPDSPPVARPRSGHDTGRRRLGRWPAGLQSSSAPGRGEPRWPPCWPTRLPTTLWARSSELAEDIGDKRENARYLPGVAPARRVDRHGVDGRGGGRRRGVFMAVPSHGFRAVLEAMAPRWCRPGRRWSAWPRASRAGPTCGCRRSSPRCCPAIPAGALSGPEPGPRGGRGPAGRQPGGPA